MKKIILSLSLVGLFAFPSFAKPDIKIDLSSKKVTMEKGKEVYKDADKSKPGEILLYTLKVMNKGNESARKLSPVGNIPDNTVYVPEKHNSADYKVLYSLDGKTFSETPTVKVKENGKDVVKPAPIDKYKKIKWVFLKDFPSNKTYVLNYKVKIK